MSGANLSARLLSALRGMFLALAVCNILVVVVAIADEAYWSGAVYAEMAVALLAYIVGIGALLPKTNATTPLIERVAAFKKIMVLLLAFELIFGTVVCVVYVLATGSLPRMGFSIAAGLPDSTTWEIIATGKPLRGVQTGGFFVDMPLLVMVLALDVVEKSFPTGSRTAPAPSADSTDRPA